MTPTQRAAFFRDHKGICYLCTRKIAPGEKWEVEHETARGLGGKDEKDNRRLAHVDCHKTKTKRDLKAIRKADRQAKKHAGIKRRSTWNTRFKKKLDGTVIDRETGMPV